MSQKRNLSYFFWTVLAIGLVIRAAIIFQAEESLLTRWGSDDLFYYSQIAGHVAEGHGFTFDGIHATNGFQPLFLFTLIPFGSLLLNDWYASWVVVSLIVTLFSVLTFFQLRRFIEELEGPEGWAIWLPALFFLHPAIITVTFNGTEAALSFLMIVLSLRAFLWLQKGVKLSWVLFIFSLLVLTRMEYSIFLFLLFSFGMLQRHALKKWLFVSIGPILSFGIWLALNYVHFENIIPSSGQAKTIHGAAYFFSFYDAFIAAWGTVFHAEAAISYSVVILVLIGAYALLPSRKMLRWMGFLFLSSLVLMTFSIWQLSSFRDWYLIPQFLLVLFCASYGIAWIAKRLDKFAPILLFIPAILWYEAEQNSRFFTGHIVLSKAEKIDLPHGTRIGSFNAGLPGAILGDNYKIVNLDGVVNNSVLEYQKSRELEAYLQKEKINYVFDFLPSIRFFLTSFGSNISEESVFCETSKKWQWCLIELNYSSSPTETTQVPQIDTAAYRIE